MANIWEHPSVIAAEALTHLEDALVITKMCAYDKTSDFTTKANGWVKGESVSFRTHGDYYVDDFSSTIDIQNIRTSSRTLTIEKHLDVSVQVTAREEVLDLDSFSAQVIKPAAYRLAESVDTYVGTKILQAAGLYASDTLFATAADIALARKAATVQQLSTSRYCLVDLSTEATLLGQTWFNQAQTRGADGETSMRSGMMGRVMGMDFYSAITFPESDHTAGDATFVTDNTLATSNLIGNTSLIVDTGVSAADGLKAGDRIAIAGVRRPLIVKTAIAQANVAAATEIELVDPITEIIPDDAAVTIVGSDKAMTYHGAIFDDRSLAVAFPMLDLPGDKVTGAASNNGISIRIVKGYDMSTKKTTLSMDLLCGAFALDPRRITLLANY
jgi:hypothetical protein